MPIPGHTASHIILDALANAGKLHSVCIGWVVLAEYLSVQNRYTFFDSTTCMSEIVR